MSGPLLSSPRGVQPIEALQANIDPEGMAATLAGLFPDDKIEQFLHPADDMAEFIYGLSQTAEGGRFIDWLLDLTLRAPYQVMGQSIEQTALNAARREGINVLGEAVLAAIARGGKSIAARKTSKPGA